MDNEKLAQKMLSIVAVVAIFGVILQLYISLSNAMLDGRGIINGLVRYLAYFTVLTNIFVTMVAVFPSFAPRSKLGLWFARPMVLGNAVTAILFVALAYHFLLRNVWHPQGLQLVSDYVMHYIAPAGLVMYWVVFAPTQALYKTAAIRWALYPLAYFVYVLGRGLLGDTYPYYFIDVSVIGYGQTVINALALCVSYVVVGMLVLASTKFRQVSNHE